MIRYALNCPSGHAFDSWFADAGAFETLQRAGKLTCPVCGEAKVEKALMTPGVRPSKEMGAKAAPGAAGPEAAATPGPKLGTPESEMEKAFATMRRQVEENSEYVGLNFVAEARRIHEGEAPERSIYGEARPDEAKRLLEDGVPVAHLPFLPSRKTH